MATIASQMTLSRQPQDALQKTNTLLEQTVSSLEQVQRLSGQALHFASLEQTRAGLSDTNHALTDMARGYHIATQEMEQLTLGADAAADSVEQLTNAFDFKKAATWMKDQAASFVKQAWQGAAQSLNSTAVLSQQMSNAGLGTKSFDAVNQAAASYSYYGQPAMQGAAATFSTYLSDEQAILAMMSTLSNYAAGMSGGGALSTTQITAYASELVKVMTGSYNALIERGFDVSDAQKRILAQGSELEKVAAVGDIINASWGGLYDTLANTPAGQLQSLKHELSTMMGAAGYALYPAILQLMDVVTQNLPLIEQVVGGIAVGLGTLLSLFTNLVAGAAGFATVMAESWSLLGPVIWGAVTAVTAFLLVSKAVAIAQTLQRAMDPLQWIIIGVGALIGLIVGIATQVANTSEVAGTAMGVIVGWVFAAMQGFQNLGLLVLNLTVGLGAALGALATNVGITFFNVIATIKGDFFALLSTVMTVIGAIAQALNTLPFIEFDYAGIYDQASNFAAAAASSFDEVKDYVDLGKAFEGGAQTFEYGGIDDAFARGAAVGDGFADKLAGLLAYEPASQADYLPMQKNGKADPTFAKGMGGLPQELFDNVGAIADHSAAAAGSLSTSEEQLAYLRDIAERDAINRFTTAEVSIDMTGMQNRIDGTSSLDELLSALTDGFSDALATAAEGVYA